MGEAAGGAAPQGPEPGPLHWEADRCDALVARAPSCCQAVGGPVPEGALHEVAYPCHLRGPLRCWYRRMTQWRTQPGSLALSRRPPPSEASQPHPQGRLVPQGRRGPHPVTGVPMVDHGQGCPLLALHLSLLLLLLPLLLPQPLPLPRRLPQLKRRSLRLSLPPGGVRVQRQGCCQGLTGGGPRRAARPPHGGEWWARPWGVAQTPRQRSRRGRTPRARQALRGALGSLPFVRRQSLAASRRRRSL